MKHTPGPWTVRPDDQYAGTYFIANRLEELVDLADNNPDLYNITNAANARLIAASPLMLKELEHAEQTLRNLGTGYLTGDAATIALNAAANIRAALAAARSA